MQKADAAEIYMLKEKTYSTAKGTIHYWTGEMNPELLTLVFLPGLSADHRLFEKQTEYFEGKYNVLTWDAPEHALSRPFDPDFTLMDKAEWLHDILEQENVRNHVLIGQSMGGYVSQCFLQKYPGEAAGFVSIDSAPLKKKYVTDMEIFLLKYTEPMYRAYPWEALKKTGMEGVAVTGYGRELMASFIAQYERDEYCRLAGHGFRMLAEAMEADLPYMIDCPAVLICGKEDHAGSAKNYNIRWAREEHLPLCMLEHAGHNANTDLPDTVNRIIEDFIRANHL